METADWTGFLGPCCAVATCYCTLPCAGSECKHSHIVSLVNLSFFRQWKYKMRNFASIMITSEQQNHQEPHVVSKLQRSNFCAIKKRRGKDTESLISKVYISLG